MFKCGVVLILVSICSVALADSIDDAEAKRRGIPVAQVIAERQLAAEQAKTVALQKQIKELQKQLDELKAAQAARAAAADPAPAPTAATPAPSTQPVATPAPASGTKPPSGMGRVTYQPGGRVTFDADFQIPTTTPATSAPASSGPGH